VTPVPTGVTPGNLTAAAPKAPARGGGTSRASRAIPATNPSRAPPARAMNRARGAMITVRAVTITAGVVALVRMVGPSTRLRAGAGCIRAPVAVAAAGRASGR